jgi:hypothetical protein
LAVPIRAQAVPAREVVPDGLRFVVESFSAGPAAIIGPRLDMLVANDIARRVSPGFTGDGLRNNLAWLAFVDPEFAETFDDREKHLRDIAAMLRYACAQHVGEREYDELIESISERSADFARAWNAFEVKPIGSEDVALRIDGEVAVFSSVVLSASEAPELTVIFLKPTDPERFRELIARATAAG